MGFAVSAEAYDRFMGRYSAPLADAFAEWAGVRPGMRVLDVGSGPGAVSAVLVDLVGAGTVAAVDPMARFIDALRERLPGVSAEVAPAEDLPFDDDTFDASLANLVVPFMADSRAGVGEMLRVTRPGGTVAASVWQHSDGISPLTPFWDGVHRVDPDAEDEGLMLGAAEGQLKGFLAECGLSDVRATALSVHVSPARHLRRVVGAVRVRRGAGGRLPRRAAARAPAGDPRRVRGAARAGPVHRRGPGLVRRRDGLTAD